MKIGKLKIENGLILAPMAGVNCAAFRLLCREEGAGMVCTAMLHANHLVEEPEKLIKRICFLKEEKPICVQLVGHDAKKMAEATKLIDKYADVIDLNLGCPEKVITSTKAGSYFIKYPEKIKPMIDAIIKNTNKPVTAKIRIGWDEKSINTEKVVKILQDAGVDAVTIHGRTVNQGYSGKADWSEIKKAKEKFDIPIIGNGDVFKPGSATAMMNYTKCDGVMIGRAAIGDPFIFKRIKYLLEKGKNGPETTKEEKKEGFLRLMKYYEKFEGGRAFSELRQQSMWFLKGLDNSKKSKIELMKTETVDEIKEIYNKF